MVPLGGEHQGAPPGLPDRPENHLATALRRVADLLCGRRLAPAALRRANRVAEDLVETLTGGAEPGRAPRHFPSQRDEPMGYFPTSPMIGWANPIAPPAVMWRVLGEDGRPEVRGTVRFGYAYEGPPDLVHGGVIAGLFDEVLGTANVVAGPAGFTGTLTVRYRRPTPLLADLDIQGRQLSAEGRKIRSWAGLYHDGELTAEAEGLFVAVDPGAFSSGP